MKKKNILLRSFMFLPAYNKKFLDKALLSDADALILDLEDSVPPECRQEARQNIIEYQNEGKLKGKTIFVRINEIDSADFIEDINQMVLPDVDGFMPSKIRTAEDIRFIDRLLGVLELKNKYEKRKYLLAPLIETTGAVMNIKDIVIASERLVAVCFGGEDYLNDLGSTYSYQTTAFEYARAAIANAARMAGILPIDTPYLEIADTDGFVEVGREMYKRGFAGCLLLNPKQIEAAHIAFSPTAEEIEYSNGVIESINEGMTEKKSGVAMYKGTMVGPPMRRRAYKVKEIQALIEGK